MKITKKIDPESGDIEYSDRFGNRLIQLNSNGVYSDGLGNSLQVTEEGVLIDQHYGGEIKVSQPTSQSEEDGSRTYTVGSASFGIKRITLKSGFDSDLEKILAALTVSGSVKSSGEERDFVKRDYAA